MSEENKNPKSETKTYDMAADLDKFGWSVTVSRYKGGVMVCLYNRQDGTQKLAKVNDDTTPAAYAKARAEAIKASGKASF